MESGTRAKLTAGVICQETLGTGIYSLWLAADRIAREAVPGQFVSVYTNDASRLLPRPVSLCEIDGAQGRLHLVYRVQGGGTAEFSRLKAGDQVQLLGPLGNGFPLDFGAKKVFLIGGGIGIPPMLELAKRLPCETQAVLGYRDSNLFLKESFEKYTAVAIATEDGSVGTKGNVLDAIREQGLSADVICACGPTPMLRALKAYAAEREMECYLSLEERMACGIGACLACVCKTTEVDAHSHVKNRRICKDGPVFRAGEVEL